MLRKLNPIGGLFGGAKIDHPLADGKQFRAILAEIPSDNAFRALDEVVGWLESLQSTPDFPADRLFDVVRQLDEAAQPHVRRLTRNYLLTPRLSRSEEKRLWSIVHGFWSMLAVVYERCLEAAAAKEKVPDSLKSALPLLSVRLIGALGALLKWDQMHYGPLSPAIWARLGQAYLLAERAGAAKLPVQRYLNLSGMTHVQQEYVRVLAFQAASMDSLLPFEIELAERMIAHFLPGFVFGPEADPDSVYWVDVDKSQPPMRLARLPHEISSTLRFFQPGTAHAEMEKLLRDLEMGGELPVDLNLGAQYQVRAVVPVLRHLCAYLAPVPPQRRHQRHRVKHRMSVMPGLVNACIVFAGEFGSRVSGLQMESWVVDNVSRGGFGVRVNDLPSDWIKVGVLLAMQPEGGENWLLGIVRRYHRQSRNEAHVGIEALARQVLPIDLKPRTAPSYAAATGVPGLLILDGNEPGEVRVVVAPATFDLRDIMEYDDGVKVVRLTPVALVESTADFEVARYRILAE